MKTGKIGLFASAALMAATFGFGVAQAGETHIMGEFMEWRSVELVEGGPSGNPAWTLQDEAADKQYQDFAVGPWEASSPVGTGLVPGAGTEEPWMKDYGND